MKCLKQRGYDNYSLCVLYEVHDSVFTFTNHCVHLTLNLYYIVLSRQQNVFYDNVFFTKNFLYGTQNSFRIGRRHLNQRYEIHIECLTFLIK